MLLGIKINLDQMQTVARIDKNQQKSQRIANNCQILPWRCIKNVKTRGLGLNVFQSCLTLFWLIGTFFVPTNIFVPANIFCSHENFLNLIWRQEEQQSFKNWRDPEMSAFCRSIIHFLISDFLRTYNIFEKVRLLFLVRWNCFNDLNYIYIYTD